MSPGKSEDTYPVSDKAIEELSGLIKENFHARLGFDREEILDSLNAIEESVTEIEEDSGIDDLLRCTDLWYRIREGTVDGSASIFRRTGYGFHEAEFTDDTEIPAKRYVYFISLPKEYEPDGEKRFPVILFLHPEITWRYRKLEREVKDMLDTIYTDDVLLDNYIIIAPVGPLVEKRRKDELKDAGKDWESLSPGRETAFIAVRLLLENMVFDRTKVFLHGIGKAGLAAYRYATWYPSFFAGVIGRDADLAPLAMENTKGIRFLYISSSENEDKRRAAAMKWIESGKDRDEKAPAKLSLIEDTGTKLEASEKSRKELYAWLEATQKDISPKEVYMKAADLAKSGSYWLRITQVDVGMDTKITDPDCAWIRGTLDAASNSVILKSTRVQGVMIFVNDKILDLDKRVSIIINGDQKFDDFIRRDLERMLDLMYYNTAGGYEIYCNFVELSFDE
jgi:hypothetical protein